MLRSATRWHEQGEKNNKYFFNVIKQRQKQQTIQSIRCPNTGQVWDQSEDILRETRSFYTDLYSPEDVDLDAIDTLLNTLPSSCCLDEKDKEALCALISRSDMASILQHTPANKSPGLDGLSFELYKFLFDSDSLFRKHLLVIMNDALERNVFPSSWKLTRMVLLFKKGDPQLLKNWRPLSLINTDAKLFTKLLANRFNEFLGKLINPFQTGFMRGRLISDNGWVHQALMDHIRVAAPNSPMVSVLLDQEKAYDRVNGKYLELVLVKFGFPPSIVTVILDLFHGTRISLSINGWLGPAFNQQRVYVKVTLCLHCCLTWLLNLCFDIF
jgi:hypothetical protein